MYNQCLAWDGNQLAALENYNVETGTLRFYSPEHVSQLPFTVDPQLGTLSALVMSSPMIYSDTVEQMLSTLSFTDFMTFYRRATKFGLLKKEFSFLLIAVLSSKVIALDVHASQSFVVKGNRDTPMAIGVDAAATLALMNQSVPAFKAVAAQSLSVYSQHNQSYRRSCSLTNMNNNGWHHEIHEGIDMDLPGRQISEDVTDGSI